MKKLLFILLFIPVILQAQTTYYIDPGGNDGTGTGTIGNPWKSLYKACSSVSGSGDIIHVNAGTYTEINQCVLDPNVSIEGASEVTSIIKMQYANSGGYEAGIVLVGGSNTSQHIRNITLDGDNLTGYQGIAVYQRSHVSIYSCIIKNFFLHGVLFGAVGSHDNMFYSNQLTNCGGQPNHTANLKLSYQTNFSCHDNTITQTARGVNDNGNGVASYEACYGMKFYNNVITVAPYLVDGIWKFAVELFLQSGLEMYGNTIKGIVDLGKDVTYGTYPYGIYFHNNTVGWDAVQSVSTIGLELEQTAEGVIICNNTFKNLDCPIWFCQYHYSDDYVQDVWIYSNLLYNCGKSNSSSGWGIRFQTGDNPDDYYPPTDCDNINIWNNTIVAYSSYPGARGIELPSHATSTTVSNIDIKNNIIVGFSVAGITARQQDNDYSPAISGLTIADNILYGNGNSNNALWVGFTPGGYSNDGGIKSDPSFVSSPKIGRAHV